MYEIKMPPMILDTFDSRGYEQDPDTTRINLYNNATIAEANLATVKVQAEQKTIEKLLTEHSTNEEKMAILHMISLMKHEEHNMEMDAKRQEAAEAAIANSSNSSYSSGRS